MDKFSDLNLHGHKIRDLGNGTSGGDAVTFRQIPVITKGDIFTFDGTTFARLAVGADGLYLKADSGTSTGLTWASGGGGGGGGGGNTYFPSGW